MVNETAETARNSSRNTADNSKSQGVQPKWLGTKTRIGLKEIKNAYTDMDTRYVGIFLRAAAKSRKIVLRCS